MSGLGGALSIAGWTLYNSQLALQVTSNNVANANTEGYSKQTLKLEPNFPLNIGPGSIGTGARATEVVRAHDDFINSQVNTKASQYYYWKAQNDAMSEIETIFNETGDTGLNAMLSKFWSAWGDLADNPDGTAEREALLAQTETLVQTVKNMDYDLRETQRNLDDNIRGSVDQVNTLVQQIADLNNQISGVEVKGSVNANDLRDRRDQLLKSLSEYMDISYYEEENSGQVMVYILGGTPLVLGKNTYSLDSQFSQATGFSSVVWQDESGRTVDITDKLEGGKIAGWVNVRDNGIDTYLDSLNTLTDELTWQVNSLHADGTGIEPVSSMTGTVDITSPDDDLGANFYFSDRYNSGGQFDIVVYDSSGNVQNTYNVNPTGNTVQDLMNAINGGAAGTREVTASLVNNKFNISADSGYTFAVEPHDGGETSHALAIMGVNTFFSWKETTNELNPVSSMTGNVNISSATKSLATGFNDSDQYNAGGRFDIVVYDASGDVSNTYSIEPNGNTVQDLIDAIDATTELDASITAGGFLNIQAKGGFAGYTFAVKPHGGEETSHALAILGVESWEDDRYKPIDDLTQTVGVNAALKENSSLISTGVLDENHKVAPGDNTIALGISGLQDEVITNLGGGGVNTSMDSYYSSLVARVGVAVQSVDTNQTYNEKLMDQYIQKQEGVTGVNLDEEMTDILKFQQLYQAAAKIISVCDEMMQSLLSTK
jgi:flagellar hook-associated protein 1